MRYRRRAAAFEERIEMTLLAPDETDAAAALALASGDESTLTGNERRLLARLLASKTLDDRAVAEVLAVQQRHRSPLLSVLVALGYLNGREYAARLAELTQTGYATAALDSPELAADEAFVRRFTATDLVRFLFCPVRQVGGTVLTLAVHPDDPNIARLVGVVAPGAEIVTLTATPFDITRRVDQVFRHQLRDEAVHSLRRTRPELSASIVFTTRQKVVFAIVCGGLGASLLLSPWPTVRAIVTAINVGYLAAIVYKLVIGVAAGLPRRHPSPPADADLDPASLPIYSILVPVYKEPAVIPTLLRALERLDYPPEKLDVLILLEESDQETIAAAKAAKPPAFFRFIYVPPGQPQTKPKACNYGLSFCRGELVTIFDAEDIPEPDQLKAAVRAFRSGREDLVCVQAALNYFNAKENYLTRMFTLEYSYWFDYMLPGLDRLRLPIPLGGTSNHFLLSRLRSLGAWDPYNVTEDADLGIRATAERYRVGVIRSTTYEEAPSRPRNWMRQRSRWIKGYMQTWLVHNREPIALLKRIGLRQWLSFQCFIGGTCLTFLANPLLWLAFVISLIAPQEWGANVFTDWNLRMSAFAFVAGNGIGILQCVIGVGRRRQYSLIPFALTNPFYWCLHSIAAYIALWQLFTKPFYWEKTVHGLTSVDAQAVLPTSGRFGTVQSETTA
jgi:glycosyltransferase XagB